MKRGTPSEKIKVFGIPVSKKFSTTKEGNMLLLAVGPRVRRRSPDGCAADGQDCRGPAGYNAAGNNGEDGMAWGSVEVNGPAGDDVYINGNYEQPAGQTNNTYAVEYGENTFETLDGAGNVAMRAQALVDDEHKNVTVQLSPVA